MHFRILWLMAIYIFSGAYYTSAHASKAEEILTRMAKEELQFLSIPTPPAPAAKTQTLNTATVNALPTSPKMAYFSSAFPDRKTPGMGIQIQGSYYGISFGRWIFVSNAVSELLRSQGLPISQTRLVKNLKIYFKKEADVQLLFDAWKKSPLSVNWNHFLSGVKKDDGGFYVTVKAGLLQYSRRAIPPTVEKLEQIIADKKTRDLFLMNLAWLQCPSLSTSRNHIVEPVTGRNVIDDFRYCLGDTFTSTTTQFFSDQMVTGQDETKIDLKMFFDQDNYIADFRKISAANVSIWLDETSRWSYQDLVKSLQAHGHFPESYARLQASKLMSRRNQIAEAYGVAGITAPKYTEINEPGIIENGEIVAEYPHFKINRSVENWRHIFLLVLEENTELVKSAVKELLRGLPFTSVSIAKWFSAGFLFRLKRNIIENPHPTDGSDLFLVKDTLLFGVTFGLGYQEAFGTRVWINGGAGWMEHYERYQVSGSRKQAEELDWSMPLDMLEQHQVAKLAEPLIPNSVPFDRNSEYRRMKPGESFSYSAGFMGGPVTGFNARVPDARLRSAFLLGKFYKTPESFEVSRTMANDLIVRKCDDVRSELFSKVFFRVWSRLVRVPIFRYSNLEGSGDCDVYRLPGVDFADLPKRSRTNDTHFKNMLIKNAIDLRSLDPIKDHYLPSSVELREYSGNSMGFNLPFLSQSHSQAEFQTELKNDEVPGDYRLYQSKWNSTIDPFHSGLVQSCNTVGAIKYKSDSKKEIEDIGIQFQCRIKPGVQFGKDTSESLRQLLQKAGVELPPRLEFKEKDRLLIQGQVYKSSLDRQILDFENEDFFSQLRKEVYELALVQSTEDFQYSQYLAWQALKEIEEQTSVEDRLSVLVRQLNDQRAGLLLRELLLPRLMPGVFTQFTTILRNKNATDINEFHMGQPQKSPAIRFIEYRSNRMNRSLLDSDNL